MSELSPARIMEVGMGFWPAKTLLSAVELDLFTTLGDGSMNGEELGRALGLHPRAYPDFFDALVATGMLARDGDGPHARYRNTDEGRRFLDRRSAESVAGFLAMVNARLYRFWGDLTEALKTGRPQNEVKHNGAPMFEELYRDPARLAQFMDAMAGISMANFRALAERFDFGPYRTVADVGGASGLLSITLAARHPHLRCTSYDLPVVTPIATRKIAEAGLADRVRAADLDAFRQPIPPADVVTMGLILHDWNLEKKLQLVRAAYDALPAGGAFIAVENLIDDPRRTNAFGLHMSLNMLVEFGDAFDFTGADFGEWCRDAGFREVRIVPLGGPASAAVAIK